MTLKLYLIPALNNVPLALKDKPMILTPETVNLLQLFHQDMLATLMPPIGFLLHLSKISLKLEIKLPMEPNKLAHFLLLITMEKLALIVLLLNISM